MNKSRCGACARQEVRIRCGELSDAERAVSQLQSSAYYPVCRQLALARNEPSAATLPEHFERRIAAIQALAEEPLQRSDIPPEPSVC
nr:ATPase involved in DNA repair [Escherichia coli]